MPDEPRLSTETERRGEEDTAEACDVRYYVAISLARSLGRTHNNAFPYSTPKRTFFLCYPRII